jgi:DNA processing protein
MTPTDRERYLLLNFIEGIGSTRLRALLDAFGSLEALWRAPAQTLGRAPGIGPALAQRISLGRQAGERLAQELERARQLGLEVVTLADAEYPSALREIPDPPLALYMKGRLPAAEEPAVSVVGARRASLYGLEVAERLAYELALRGVAVVSGLARGIDGAAHRGALRAGGRTVAILGGALDRLYPPEHAQLADQISLQGALVSEYALGMPPLAGNFPRRNRIISGLSLGVVVVEAGPRSGALITADLALEQGKEVFVVPGPITSVTSRGTHELAKQGARLVTSVEDIVEELRLTPRPAQQAAAGPTSADLPARGAQAGLPGSEAEARVLGGLSVTEPRSFDAISARSGMGAAPLAALLLDLELRGQVRRLAGARFLRLAAAPCADAPRAAAVGA